MGFLAPNGRVSVQSLLDMFKFFLVFFGVALDTNLVEVSAKFNEIVHCATPTNTTSSLICELTASVIIDIVPLCYNVMGC